MKSRVSTRLPVPVVTHADLLAVRERQVAVLYRAVGPERGVHVVGNEA
jgi:hypothetical protein